MKGVLRGVAVGAGLALWGLIFAVGNLLKPASDDALAAKR